MRTIDWVQNPDGPPAISMIDQTKLPGALELLTITDADELIGAIQRLSVRGAPALGVAGAMGVALVAATLPADDARAAAARIRQARPTAVNLAVGVDRALAAFEQSGPDGALTAALALRDEEVASSIAMSALGADLVRELTGKDQITMMTICNTGGLAAVEVGTALGVIGKLHADGNLRKAIPLETRPLLQGARLTAWELQNMGADFELIIDSAAALVLATGEVDAIVVGADRIAANGDTANKIGTFSLAVNAQYAGVPFIVVAPETTVDLSTASGADIEIEDRGPDEVGGFGGVRTAPAGIAGRNPAFDVTPASLITAIVTERRVVRPGASDTVMADEFAQTAATSTGGAA